MGDTQGMINPGAKFPSICEPLTRQVVNFQNTMVETPSTGIPLQKEETSGRNKEITDLNRAKVQQSKLHYISRWRHTLSSGPTGATPPLSPLPGLRLCLVVAVAALPASAFWLFPPVVLPSFLFTSLPFRP